MVNTDTLRWKKDQLTVQWKNEGLNASSKLDLFVLSRYDSLSIG